MQTILCKIAAYIIIFTLIGVMGALIAKFTEYSGMSQYMSNFIYAVIIIIYGLENWTLVLDLNKVSYVIKNETEYIQRIKNITELNKSLAIENAKLKEKITRLEAQKSVANVQRIISWRKLWVFDRMTSECPVSI